MQHLKGHTLSNFEKGAASIPYYINLEPIPLRNSGLAYVLIIISHLHIQSVLSFLNTTAVPDYFFHSFLKVIDAFKISTYDSFSTNGNLRFIIWAILVFFLVSIIIGTLYIMLGADRRLKRMVLIAVLSFQIVFEFLFLVPTVEYTFFDTVPTCDYDPTNVQALNTFQNNNQLSAAYKVSFYVLFGFTMIANFILVRIFVFSFKQHFHDRLLEQNKLAVCCYRVFCFHYSNSF